MKNREKIKSLLNTASLLLITIVLFPSVFQLAHVFEKHEQNYCFENSTHIHEHEIECSVCDFKLNSTDEQLPKYVEFLTINFDKQLIYEYYNFKYNHQHLSYSLRGPPSLTS